MGGGFSHENGRGLAACGVSEPGRGKCLVVVEVGIAVGLNRNSEDHVAETAS